MTGRTYDSEKWLQHIEEGIARGPYTPDYDSLSRHGVPRWFRDGKLGIFLHWGVYSVPAFGNEWYPRNMYIRGSREYEHHRKTYGDQKDFGYKNFIPMFQAQNFDPDAWAELLAASGAKYVVPVAEHHDGFQMYRSELSSWNAYDMGPKRDLVGDLSKALEKKGIVTGASTHRIEHWFFFEHGRDFDSDVPENAQKKGDLYWPAQVIDDSTISYNTRQKPAPSEEFLEDWMIRTVEIIDRLHPKELYFDWWIMQDAAKPYLKKIACYYFNEAAARGEEVLITAKLDALPIGMCVPDMERGQFAEAEPMPWQTDTAAAKNSWCYTEGNDFKKPETILLDFVDCIAKNGCMLLNVGPRADGTFSREDTHILRTIGEWMQKNSEAVYGSRPYRFAAEGPTKPKVGGFTDGTDSVYTSEDFRFVTNHGNLYVFAMHMPEDGNLLVKSLAAKKDPTAADWNAVIRDVSPVGFDAENFSFRQDEQGLHLYAPGIRTDAPAAFRIRTV